MSVKRQATTQLTHDNWDKDDPSEHEEMGTFKTASKDILEKRVIKTAKRRSQVSGDETKKSVFSGFSGFNKTQPTSFDFLANLTNNTQSKAETSVTSSLFSNKPLISSSSSGLFSIQTTTTPTKPTFGLATCQSSPFAGINTTTSVFNTLKPDSTVSDSPFKIQAVSSSADTNIDSTNMVTSSSLVTTVSTTIFSISTTTSQSLFSNSNNTTPFKIQPVSSTTTVPTTNVTIAKETSNSDSKKEIENEKKLEYYAKLQGLNESVSAWIKSHVDSTPLCILSPIFRDYERHLKNIREEYRGPAETNENKVNENNDSKNEVVEKPTVTTSASQSIFSTALPTTKTSLFSSQMSPSVFGQKTTFSNTTDRSGIESSRNTNFTTKENTTTITTQSTSILSGDKNKGTLFGINPSVSIATTTTSITGFKFGITSTTSNQMTTANSSGFSFGTSTPTTTTTSTATPFSFGIGKPFSFNSNIQTLTSGSSEAKEKNEENEDEPPKVEFTPVVEENSVYDKRCKIFVKRDGNFVDKGVGTLYIKKIDETGKHQLLVRANTNLGNILLNIILSSSIPTERMGKNNVMLICIPTPDAKPPPTPVLIRVKTTEEADDLLETLKKYKT